MIVPPAWRASHAYLHSHGCFRSLAWPVYALPPQLALSSLSHLIESHARGVTSLIRCLSIGAVFFSSILLLSIALANASMLQRKNLLEQFKERLEPSVAGPTIVNDGSIFMALGIWYEHALASCALQQSNAQKQMWLNS